MAIKKRSAAEIKKTATATKAHAATLQKKSNDKYQSQIAKPPVSPSPKPKVRPTTPGRTTTPQARGQRTVSGPRAGTVAAEDPTFFQEAQAVVSGLNIPKGGSALVSRDEQGNIVAKPKQGREGIPGRDVVVGIDQLIEQGKYGISGLGIEEYQQLGGQFGYKQFTDELGEKWMGLDLPEGMTYGDLEGYQIQPPELDVRETIKGEDGIEMKELDMTAKDAVDQGMEEKIANDVMNAYEQGLMSAENARKFFTKQHKADEEKIQDSASPSSYYGQYSQDYDTETNSYEDPQLRAIGALDAVGNMSFDQLFNQLINSDVDMMTSGDLIKQNLLMNLVGAEMLNKDMDQFFATSIAIALDTYMREKDEVVTSRAEIDKAISGKAFIPETYEGLTAKILKESESLQMESIKTTKRYQQSQYEAWRDDTRVKRARLEGYLKAKLYASGAQDSSAGLTLLASVVDQADLRIQQQRSEYMYNFAQLDIEGRRVMMNFTNDVLKMSMDTKTKSDNADANLQDEIRRIQGEKLMNDREKNKLQLEAFSTFNTQMVDYKNKQAQMELDLLKWNYDILQDARENAFKMDGVTGTEHYVDGAGNIIDTGIPTFEYDKWVRSDQLDVFKLNHTIANDNAQLAIDAAKADSTIAKDKYGVGLDMIRQGMSAEDVEIELGLRPGALKGAKSETGLRDNLAESVADLWGLDEFIADDLATYNSQQKEKVVSDALEAKRRGQSNAQIEKMVGLQPGALLGEDDPEFIEAVIRDKMLEDAYVLEIRQQMLEEAGSTAVAGIPTSNMFTAFADGTHGGQCGTAMHDLYDINSMGDLLPSKVATMDNILNGVPLAKNVADALKSIPGLSYKGSLADVIGNIAFGYSRGHLPQSYLEASELVPHVGDMVVLDVGTIHGHVAMINSINADGTMTLSESNWKGDELWTNNRTIDTADPKIVGLHRGDLNQSMSEWLSDFDSAQRAQGFDFNKFGTYMDFIRQGGAQKMPWKERDGLRNYYEQFGVDDIFQQALLDGDSIQLRTGSNVSISIVDRYGVEQSGGEDFDMPE